MSHSAADPAQPFGGGWTEEKLSILAAYLDAYTTALKDQPFRLIYVDAFAGSGAVHAQDDDDGRQLLEGSPMLALEVQDKAFDHLVFIEQDPTNAESLRRRIAERGDSDRTEVLTDDANRYLPAFCSGDGRVWSSSCFSRSVWDRS